jgi:carbamoyl-phosphate synthase large subunit
MPARRDIKTILLIGSGPIVIGQACEFDYAGTQAISALKEDGYRVILVNSNPATIMTDPGLADKVYIEPLLKESVELVIEKERPDALLPTMGGQTALNLAVELEASGVLSRYGVKMIGADSRVIKRAEDREEFRQLMKEIGLKTPRSRLVKDREVGAEVLSEVGLPLILRPSFTLGGTGGGIAYSESEYWKILGEGLSASPVGSVLVEQSIEGWKEYEMEVVRDKNDNCIIVCSIENMDPMGVHTGDSITVAPSLTLTDKEYQKMRDASFLVLRSVGVETGGSNVQFAVDPETGEMVVIEMNPRVSRSSALASKATGFPIARVATKLAVGYSLDELKNSVTDVIPASFEPTLDYVVTKIPRFNFEKFPGCDEGLTTSMKSVGEVMALGRTYEESFQKALCSMDNGWSGFEEKKLGEENGEGVDIFEKCSSPRWDRVLWLGQSFREDCDVLSVAKASGVDLFFLRRIESLVIYEGMLIDCGFEGMDGEKFWEAKGRGFSDRRLGKLWGLEEGEVRKRRMELGVCSVYRRIDTVAGEFSSTTPYLYSTYERPLGGVSMCESEVSERRKVIILGSGPNRIGQGVEFDYCCVHAVQAFREEGIETIMVNCNPETVSTDFDTADRLYFEPLTLEHVLGVVEVEKSRGELLGVVLQFGGQTPLKLAKGLSEAGVEILGTSVSSIDAAEDRDECSRMLARVGVKQPTSGMAWDVEGLVEEAARIGYPVMIRPSYVLGGRSMYRAWNEESLRDFGERALKSEASGGGGLLVDCYLEGAIEFDVDAVSDGEDVWISGIVEHIEEAGIHSGDSACMLPARSLSEAQRREMEEVTEHIARALQVRGMVNVQYGLWNGELYVLEVNPRASRTVPFVAKARGIAVARYAGKVLSGCSVASLDLRDFAGEDSGKYAVKESVFPFMRFGKVDTRLGPEMRSTGEVMGVGMSEGEAFLRAQEGAGEVLPDGGNVFVSLCERDRGKRAIDLVKSFASLGFGIYATRGTSLFLKNAGVDATMVKKARESGDNVLSMVERGEIVLVVNTPGGARSASEAHELRCKALRCGVPCFTTLASGEMVVKGLRHQGSHKRAVYSIRGR